VVLGEFRMEGCNGHNSSGSRSLERAISRKAMQAGSSAPCKTWLIGFFCGVCITCLFGVVALPPLRVIQSQSVYPLPLRRAILSNFTFTQPAGMVIAAHPESALSTLSLWLFVSDRTGISVL